MSIFILGGHAKGHALLVPNGDKTKPTSVMLRRKFFDSKQDCSGIVFVDLFAGTGSVGLEALSRGAHEVSFCEKDRNAYRILSKNIQSTSEKIPGAKTDSYQSDSLKWLSQFLTRYKNFDEAKKENTIIYIDPPYELKNLYIKCLETLSSIGFSGEVWIESDRQKGYELTEYEGLGFKTSKVFKQGTSYIVLVVLI